ncbi:MAG: hypothetical protein ACRD5B_01330 [Nitrososphaeraceae archaeon]
MASGNFVNTSMLLDAVTSLIDAFKQACYNSPTRIQVDKLAFDKMLEEASKLYSSINVKDSIANQEFSIAETISIVLEQEKDEGDIEGHYPSQRGNEETEPVKVTREHDELPSLDRNQKQTLPGTTTKYECAECNATFDTPAGHRKHHQAFHGNIEEPKVIEQAEI